jgi:predicted glycogen debranching enzyme
MDEQVIQRVAWKSGATKSPSVLSEREWIVSNGLGGYAAGTIGGVATRRYHGLLIAALPAPLGRTMMFNHLAEEANLPDGCTASLNCNQHSDESSGLAGEMHLAEFSLRMGLPVWRYEAAGFALEKRLAMPHGQNSVAIQYRLLAGYGQLLIRLRPAFQFRGHNDPVSRSIEQPYPLTAIGDRFELHPQDFPAVRLRLLSVQDAGLLLDGGRMQPMFYQLEADRGYDCRGVVWSPGYFRARLAPGESLTLVASTESWEVVDALSPDIAFAAELERRSWLLLAAGPQAAEGVGEELVLAADQFIIQPTTRLADTARAHATGDEARTVIAGYYWFGDWGRDTMISLEGLTMSTGRVAEARWILRMFANYVRDGLIPNLFPEGATDGQYHTADATLWFFHALARYVAISGDRETLQQIFPKLHQIIAAHLTGTRFGIGVDPSDGLLRQGAQGYQLTWMDAKVGEWVVTPRRGKAVEINALWYDALSFYAEWLREIEHDDGLAATMAEHAARARESFNRRFWNAERNCLYDVVDGEQGDDASIRPNQLFAISLTHPVLEQQRWRPVLATVTERLLTPAGLRSLAPGEPDYKPRYDGDLRSRDAAYHQGTVWGWLIGPFVDAWLRVNPGDRAVAREFLTGFGRHLGEACVGSISEVFDAEAPYTPRGCPAQAWSVAEALRAWVKTSEVAQSSS